MGQPHQLGSEVTCVLFTLFETLCQALTYSSMLVGAYDEAPGICAHILIFFSVILAIVTLPFSLCLVIKVVQVCVTYLY